MSEKWIQLRNKAGDALYPKIEQEYVVDSSSRMATLPNVQGGKVYVFEQPLAGLTIESVESAHQESEVRFTAAMVSRATPDKINLWIRQRKYDDGSFDIVQTSAAIELIPGTTPGRWSFAPKDYVLCDLPNEMSIPDARRTVLSGGSIWATSSAGGWVVSARQVKQILQSGTENESGGIEFVTYSSSTVSGVLATGAGSDIYEADWTNGGVMFHWAAGDGGAWTEEGDDGICGVEPVGSKLAGPVNLPANLLLLNSSSFTPQADKRYLLRFKDGMLETFTVNSLEV